MDKFSVDSLKAGMIFSEPVYVEEDNILVPAGEAIRQKDIDRLISWGIESVESEGKPVEPAGQKSAAPVATDQVSAAAPPPQEAKPLPKKKEAPAVKKAPSNVITLAEVQGNTEIYRSYMDIIERLDKVFTEIAEGENAEARSIDSITKQLLKAVREHQTSMIGFILGGKVSGLELAKSSVNTAILSALIATELKQPNQKVMNIAIGALLHDVGMLRLPKELISKKGGLSPMELQRMQAHPLFSYRIVTRELNFGEDIGIVVLQHHERWDGEGYPRKTAGAAIDFGARIVSVVDAFEAMVSQKSYRNSMIGYQAMKNLLSDNSRRFDPHILKAFIQTMGIYPIGSIILLNNGAMARVTEVHGNAHLRPKIEILMDENEKTGEGKQIDLLKEKRIYISRALDPQEVSQ